MFFKAVVTTVAVLLCAVKFLPSAQKEALSQSNSAIMKIVALLGQQSLLVLALQVLSIAVAAYAPIEAVRQYQLALISMTSLVLIMCTSFIQISTKLLLFLSTPAVVQNSFNPSSHAMCYCCQQCNNANSLFTKHSRLLKTCVVGFVKEIGLCVVGAGNFYLFVGLVAAKLLQIAASFTLSYSTTRFVEHMFTEGGLFLYKSYQIVGLLRNLYEVFGITLMLIQKRPVDCNVELLNSLNMFEAETVVMVRKNDVVNMLPKAQLIDKIGDVEKLKGGATTIKNEYGYEEEVEIMTKQEAMLYLKSLSIQWQGKFEPRFW